ncbi:NACHT domain-containing protein [Actinoallomurus rhizosphaericola]|uniref:NACHT domain-containing protein n=1 Tax=Actinoallomurus rhizosphaericola TaxID=2952536 RepID=UPI002091B97D|nr:NACHT domain-containing protein [Actinoallomurus rhizosphaericola]MCO5992230.1 NACHT domain-containing protein [Actinoallomurus rhizosphaericola]
MALEAVAVAVGKALGRHLAQTWLTGRSAEQERARDLVDLLQTRFPDRIVRRRFERQIDDIADQVAERLLTMCGHEYGGLRENDKAAALAEVAQTLAGADLSDRALLATDLDPARLASHVRAGLPRRGLDGQLGEAGARLYDVVLDECCDCFARIVQQLPQFGPRASTETLARLTAVADQVSLLLARLPVRTLDAPEGTATDEAFRRRYLEHVSTTLDVLELFGVRVERYRPRTTLSVAYISLSVSTDEEQAERSRRSAVPGMLDIAEWRRDEPPPGEATLRVETALGRAPLTLIRGEAGSGKSTLLRWLAISAARGAFTGDLADWNGCVPFLIKLRSHTGGTLPSPERFLEGVADPIAGLMPAGWVHRVLGSGRALLMIDGVDELPGARRRAVRPWLSGLLAAYPGLRVVVTSRPAAASADWLAGEGFATALLERMTPADVKELVRHWHEAVRDAGDLPCAPEQLPGFEAALLARLESAPHLRALAGSPLLAAMLCALNLDREKQLPRDRMGLYAAALELLLERRDVERQIAVDDALVLERGQKMLILQDLAWRLSITGRTELPKDAVVRWIGTRLATMPSAPTDAEAVLDHLLERSGVLREPVAGRIDFVHRTVQEYLTAKQFAEDGDLEPLLAQAHKDQWRETIIMAAGHANAPQRAELLGGLFRRIEAEPRHARRLKLLIAGCLETLPAVPAELRSAVDACLDDLVPPRDLASARSLASVGETILDRLPETLDALTPAAARAVVRTAWLVNGPRALDLLAGYGTDPRSRVQEELIKGWEYFDPEDYARRVLADAPLSHHFLRLPALRLLTAVRHVRRLTRLRIADRLAGLSFLRDLDQPISHLIVNQLESGDLGPLTAHADSLEWASISTPAVIRDMKPLCSLPKLWGLRLASSGLRDLSFIRDLPTLHMLTLENLEHVTDFSPLRAQTSLRELTLEDCPALTDLDVLPSLENLEELQLIGSSLGSGLEELVRRAPKVRLLYVNNSPWVTELRPLAELDLTALGLWGCRGLTDFTPLADLRNLHFLDLEDTGIDDLGPLSGLKGLNTLWLRHCADVSDLTPLGDLRELRQVYLKGVAPGIDLAPLAGLRKVTVYVEPGQDVRNGQLLGRRLQVG